VVVYQDFPEAMAEKIIYLLQNPAVARQMGERGYQEVSKYNYPLMVSRQEELYRQLIASSKLCPT